MEIRGSGSPRRGFFHGDDFADAAVFLMKTDLTIAELARIVADVVGYTGRFAFDASKPDGTPRELLDVSKLTALGWRPRIDLEEGIRETYDWYRHHRAVSERVEPQ